MSAEPDPTKPAETEVAQTEVAQVEPLPSELLDMSGRVVVVTGASGNIGLGIARRFLAVGATLVAHTRTVQPDAVFDALQVSALQVSALHADVVAGAAAAKPIGTVSVVVADLTHSDGPRELIEAVMSSHGRIDALVNNAGIQSTAAFEQITDAEWSEMIDTNLTAVHRLTQLAAEAMAANPAGGSVVHVASIEAHHPTLEHGHYATAKAALVMHAKAAALAYGKRGSLDSGGLDNDGPGRGGSVRVNSVSPGLIERPGLEADWPEGVARWRRAAPLGRLGTPADVGDACVFLCSDLARWITGVDLVVDGGVLANPTW